jgi:hypothetical protein
MEYPVLDDSMFRKGLVIYADTLKVKDETIKNLVLCYDLYKTECYNDSTNIGKVQVRYYIPEYRLWADSIKTNYYQHREPDLGGFMEFLREKVK